MKNEKINKYTNGYYVISVDDENIIVKTSHIREFPLGSDIVILCKRYNIDFKNNFKKIDDNTKTLIF